MMAEQALPGVFASGKAVRETSAWIDHNGKNLQLRFEDGSTITFMGEFRVEATQGLLDGAVGDAAPNPDAIEAGKELMRGKESDE